MRVRGLIGLIVVLLSAVTSAQQPLPPRVPPDRRLTMDEFPVARPLGEVAPALPDPRARLSTQADICAGRASAPECTLPMWQPVATKTANIRIPATDGQGGQLEYGGSATYVAPDGKSALVSCWAKDNGPGRDTFARIALPAPGGTATILEPCRGMGMAWLASGHPDPNAYMPLASGILEVGGQTIIGVETTYDAGGTQRGSHAAGPSRTQMGIVNAGTIKPGIIKGPMGLIPEPWQTLLGGPAFIGLAYRSIIGRSSYGPVFAVFDPATVVRDNFPVSLLLGCPLYEPGTFIQIDKCRARWGSPSSLSTYNGSEETFAYVIAPGTRTLAVIERESKGPTCYGYSTRDQALHGTPYPTAANPSPENVPWCYSLSDPLNEKGPKGWPYTIVVKLYDLAEIYAVKQGTRKAWDVEPAAVYELPGARPGSLAGYFGSGMAALQADGSVVFYASGQMWAGGGSFADVETWTLTGNGSAPPPPPPPPPPTDPPGGTVTLDPTRIVINQSTRLTWAGNAATTSVSIPGVANTTVSGFAVIAPKHTQDIPVTFLGAGGASTVVSARITVDEQPPPVDPCTVSPLVVTSIAWPGSAEGRRSGSFTWSVAGVVTTLKSVVWQWNPQALLLTDARDCPAKVTR